MKRNPLLLALLALSISRAAQQPPKLALHKAAPQFAWTKKAWLGDDRPYKAAREAIGKARDAGKDMLALAKQYDAVANKTPRSPLAVFRWGYAALLAFNCGDNHAASGEMFKAMQALEQAPSLYSYQYDRLRFLVVAGINRQYGVADLGERLIARDPNDFYVAYFEIPMLAGTFSQTDNQRALELSKALIEKWPTSSGGFERAGLTYQNMWWGHARKSDALTAIDYYRKAIAAAPPGHADITDSYAKQIHFIEREMKNDKRAH